MKSYKGLKLLIIAVFVLFSTSACSLVTDVLGAPTLPPTITMPALLPTEQVIQLQSTPTLAEPTISIDAAAQPALQPTAAVEEGVLRQWAAGADASSELSKEQSAAKQAIGQPDTRNVDGLCSNSPDAWAPAGSESDEWIQLSYEVPVFPTEIRIIQTNAPGQVTQVEVVDLDGVYHPIYQGEPEEPDNDICPYELHIPVKDLDAMVYAVRITVDPSTTGEISEIDAVELVGIPRDSAPTGDVKEDEVSDVFESFAARSVEISGVPAASKAPAGGYYFRVFTDDMDNTFINTSVRDRSSDDEIVIDLTSGDGQYTLTLFISPDFTSDFVVMEPYDETAADKSPSALMEAQDGQYTVAYGSYEIENAEDGTLSGNFIMALQSETNPDLYLSVEGAFNRIPVENVE